MNLAQWQFKLRLDPLGTFINVVVGYARLQSNNVVVLTGPLCTVCNSSLTVEPEDGDLIESSSVRRKNCFESWLAVLFKEIAHQKTDFLALLNPDISLFRWSCKAHVAHK